jgi:predicted Zn-dependent peptidase
MNAFTAKEYTTYVARVPAAQLSLAIDLLGDVVTSPALRDADVESERQVILEELSMDEDAPDDTAYRLFADALFPAHPLGRETAGEVDTVRAITPDDVRTFFAEHYRSDRAVLAVAGPMDHHEVVALAEEHLAGMPSGGGLLDRTAPAPDVDSRAGEERDCEQAHVLVGFRGLERHDTDREALDMVVHALGGGPSSRLFQKIREERGLTYSTYASASSYSDTGLFAAYAATNPEAAAEVLGLIEGELDAIAEHGITEDELDIARGYLCGAFAMGFEGTGSRSERLGSSLTNYGRIRPVDEQIARWQGVTLDDTRRVIERVLTRSRVRCAVGPIDLAELIP